MDRGAVDVRRRRQSPPLPLPFPLSSLPFGALLGAGVASASGVGVAEASAAGSTMLGAAAAGSGPVFSEDVVAIPTTSARVSAPTRPAIANAGRVGRGDAVTASGDAGVVAGGAIGAGADG